MSFRFDVKPSTKSDDSKLILKSLKKQAKIATHNLDLIRKTVTMGEKRISHQQNINEKSDGLVSLKKPFGLNLEYGQASQESMSSIKNRRQSVAGVETEPLLGLGTPVKKPIFAPPGNIRKIEETTNKMLKRQSKVISQYLHQSIKQTVILHKEADDSFDSGVSENPSATVLRRMSKKKSPSVKSSSQQYHVAKLSEKSMPQLKKQKTCEQGMRDLTINSNQKNSSNKLVKIHSKDSSPNSRLKSSVGAATPGRTHPQQFGNSEDNSQILLINCQPGENEKEEAKYKDNVSIELSLHPEKSHESVSVVHNTNHNDMLSDVMLHSTLNKSEARRLYHTPVISDSEISLDIEIDLDIDNYWIISPNSAFLRYLHVLLFLIIVYCLVFEPILIAFYDTDPLPFVVLSLFNDIIFFLDLFLNFITGYYDQDEQLVLNQKKIVFHYFSTDFGTDFISAIPFSIFFVNTSDEHSSRAIKLFNLSKLTRVFKICRLLRLFKIFKFFKKADDDILKNVDQGKLHFIQTFSIHSAVRSYIQFFISFIIFNHLSTCLWIFMASIDYPNWIAANNLIDAPGAELYVASLYFNFSTIFSIGYGDVHSVSSSERLYNIFLMWVGVLLYSFALSILSSTVEKQQKKEKKSNRNFELLQEIKKKYKVEDQLSHRLVRFVKFSKHVNRYDKNFLLQDIPKHLRNNLIFKMYEDSLRTIKFFRNSNNEFKYKAAVMLKQIKFNKNEYIIQAGDFIDEFYMIKRGLLQIEMETAFSKKLKILELNKNEHFGEVYMTLYINSPIDVRVKSKIAVIFYLRKSDFLELYDEFPRIITSIMRTSWSNAVRIEAKARKLYEKLEEEENKRTFIEQGNSTTGLINNLPCEDSLIVKPESVAKQLTIIREEQDGLNGGKTERISVMNNQAYDSSSGNLPQVNNESPGLDDSNVFLQKNTEYIQQPQLKLIPTSLFSPSRTERSQSPILKKRKTTPGKINSIYDYTSKISTYSGVLPSSEGGTDGKCSSPKKDDKIFRLPLINFIRDPIKQFKKEINEESCDSLSSNADKKSLSSDKVSSNTLIKNGRTSSNKIKSQEIIPNKGSLIKCSLSNKSRKGNNEDNASENEQRVVINLKSDNQKDINIHLSNERGKHPAQMNVNVNVNIQNHLNVSSLSAITKKEDCDIPKDFTPVIEAFREDSPSKNRRSSTVFGSTIQMPTSNSGIHSNVGKKKKLRSISQVIPDDSAFFRLDPLRQSCKGFTPQQKRKKSFFYDIFSNMRDVSNALKNPKNFITSTLPRIRTTNHISELSSQIDKMEDIFEDILMYYAVYGIAHMINMEKKELDVKKPRV